MERFDSDAMPGTETGECKSWAKELTHSCESNKTDDMKKLELFLERYPNLADVFAQLQCELQKDGAPPDITADAIRFSRSVFKNKKPRRFAKAHFLKKSITLELWVGEHEVPEEGIKRSRKPNHEWVSMKIYPVNNKTEKVVKWIKKAREFKG